MTVADAALPADPKMPERTPPTRRPALSTIL